MPPGVPVERARATALIRNDRPSPLRVLALNERDSPAGMGHGPVEAGLRLAATCDGNMQLRAHRLAPPGRVAWLLTRGVPGLAAHGLDAVPARWHAARAIRARRAVRPSLAGSPADVIFIHSHSIALGLVPEMRRTPTVLSLDATIVDWDAMGSARATAARRALLEPSLAAERRALAAARLVLAWSRWAREAAERACPAARVVEHRLGVDLARFRPGPVVPGPVRVLFVGSRFAVKGGFLLLEVLRPYLGQGVELDIVTTSRVPSGPGIRVHRLNANDDRLVDLYRRADVFCLPTAQDASPWALIEAMACGLAVVSSTVGAIPELLDGGRAGVLVPSRDGVGLRAALEWLLANPPARAELGARARERCVKHYDAGVQAGILARLLREAAGTGA